MTPSIRRFASRGALIVFEGCDRCGKSTQSRLLIEQLQEQGIRSKLMVFPNRTSNIGKEINAYLTNTKDLSDHVIHLLFSANRWEFRNEMERMLQSGVTLVIDRYSYSGVAYTTAKGLDYEWCFAPERGLIRPDIVFFLKMSTDLLLKRGQFGEERYEKLDFQKRVAKVYDRIYEQEKSYWHCIDASSNPKVISEEILGKTVDIIDDLEDKPLKFLGI